MGKLKVMTVLGPIEPDEVADFFHEALTPEELYSEALEVWDASKTGSLIDRTLEYSRPIRSLRAARRSAGRMGTV